MSIDHQRLNCICIDSSKYSEDAFDWYVNSYHRSDDVIGLLHVHQMPVQLPWGMMAKSIPIADSYLEIVNSSLEASRELIKNFEERCKQSNLQYKVLHTECQNSPGQEICDVAKKNGASAIIIGQRGLGKFSRMIIGSTSDYVLHHSKVPVIVIPPSKK